MSGIHEITEPIENNRNLVFEGKSLFYNVFRPNYFQFFHSLMNIYVVSIHPLL